MAAFVFMFLVLARVLARGLRKHGSHAPERPVWCVRGC